MNRYLRASLSPLKSTLEIAAVLSPELYWNRLGSLARKQGFEQLYLCLSFDCDTHKDAEVVVELDTRLREMGLLPAYAVPGQLLEQRMGEYSKLRDRGAVFLNHGYQIHTLFDETTKQYRSCLDYEELTHEEIKADIYQGHVVLTDFLGALPKGFRAPHFGNFQRASDLSFLHSYLESLGYQYSSSTSPIYASLYGPVFKKFGLPEIPVLGTASNPRKIFDSWSFFASPNRRWKDGDYLKEATLLSNLMKRHDQVGLLNCYADPSQVWQRSEFFEAMALLSRGAKCISLDSVSARLRAM